MSYYIDMLFIFVVAAAIGSFLNVCIYRMPRNESIAFPGSHCPHCNKRIHWYHNIPILSYIMLMGRCSSCKKKIAIRYLVVEILTASLILALYIMFGLNVKFFAYSALVCALIVATFIDIDFREIPDSISLGGLAAGLALSALVPGIFDTHLRSVSFINSLLGALAGGGAIYAMGVFGKVIFRKEAMGGGDVKLMAMVGSFIGWKLALISFFIAPIFGAVVGIFIKIRSGQDTMAYGPYLSLASIIAIFYGKALVGFFFYGI